MQRSVFALAAGRYELFLGYTSVESDEGRQLLMDVLPRLSVRRAEAWAALRAKSLPIFVFARPLESEDPGADEMLTNYHLHLGAAYLHDLAVEDPVLLLADDSEVTLELREADHALGILLSTGGVTYEETEDGVPA